METAAKVFSVPTGAPFLPVLLDALLAGRFGPLDRADPLAMADVTILLPTRRAVRALGELLAARMGGTAILPRIRPIGDIDEEEFLFEPPPESGEELLLLPQAVGGLQRKLELARLILAWGRSHCGLEAAPHEPLLVPAGPADAIRLAGDLGSLIDEMAGAGLSWDRLDTLVPEELQRYWQLSLDFLRIAAGFWPERLAELGLVDPATRRDRLIRAEAARLAANPPRHIFIAAGSTGSIPATAELLRTVARLPCGAVVLPGLDLGLDDAGFDAIGLPGEPGAVPGHPQYGLRQLLAGLGVLRRDVVALGEAPAHVARRAAVISDAMRPAETTEAWASAGLVEPGALAGMTLLTARNDVEEALAIALALRRNVEAGKVSALVTPDRTIARRVTAELRRFGLEVDDSAGAPLVSTAPAIFARLLAEAAASDGDPVKLLAVLKHPLAAFGLSRPGCREAARLIERVLFRGRGVHGGVPAMPSELARRLSGPAHAALDEDAKQKAVQAASALVSALEPFAAAAGVGALTEALAESLRIAAADDLGLDHELWIGKPGEGLALLLAGLIENGGGLDVSFGEYPAFLAAVMEGVKVTTPPSADPRIHIWGTLEARLQDADAVILAGLDEGVWPASTRLDAWLSRPMRLALGLEPPERRIGLSAHDFAQLAGASELLMTRAEKRGGSPTVPSRWLQRLAALIGPDAARALAAPAAEILGWARALDAVPAGEVRPAPRPEPKPAVHARPRTLSITEIEVLVRDPYSIYARHILRLRPLEEIGRPPDAALRGTIVHKVLSDFIKERPAAGGPDAEAHMIELARKAFREVEGSPDIHALWWVRTLAVIRWFLGWEGARAVAERGCEIDGRLGWTAPAGAFELKGRADRIDIAEGGAVEIFDFKTGTPPSARQVLTGFAPQLGLEAAMVRGGSFGGKFAGRPIGELAFINLGRAGRGGEIGYAYGDKVTPEQVGDMVVEQLHRLIAAYDDPAQPYRSLERPMFEHRWKGDYDHLARIAEWRIAGNLEDEE
jgi:ATP-dependent helicase/nuclease subunit B